MTTKTDLRESGTGVIKKSHGARRRAKLIAADTWGSSGYYPAEILERDGPKVFITGVQMFENHLTESQEYERPEGDLRNLVGKLVTDAVFNPADPDGPGLYADVEFYESYVPRINEIGDDIGLSVNAGGLTDWGVMEDREGPIVIAMLSAKSVDVVTKAGAGGKLTSILESDRGIAGTPIITKTEGTQSMADVTKEDFDALSASINTSISGLVDTLKEALKPAVVEVIEETPEQKADREAADAAAADEEAKQSLEIDHAALVEALRTNELPPVSAGAVVAALKEGMTLDDAIAAQVKLREAFTSSTAEKGVVNLQESSKATGLARSVEVLKG